MTHFIEVTEGAQADLQPARPTARLEVVKLDLGEVIEGRVRCYFEDLGENCLVELPSSGTRSGAR